MDRRTFLYGFTLGTLFAPITGEAQQAGRVYRVGILSVEPLDSVTQPAPQPISSVFRQSLADHGFVEGRNLSFVHRRSPDPEDFPDLARDLVRLNVDVLFASSSPAIRAAAEATTTIPVVMLSVGDPIEAGLVTSLARPGGNVTGLSTLGPELSEKLLELLKESLPRSSKIGVLGGTAVRRWRKEMEVAAHSIGTRLQFIELTDPEKEIDAAFKTIAKARADGLVLLPTLFFGMNPGRIARLALLHRLPAIFWGRQFPESGGLMAYGPEMNHLWRRAGVLVAKILKGARPADLPVEQAYRFQLIINLKTAKALGLTIPQSLLVRADQIID